MNLMPALLLVLACGGHSIVQDLDAPAPQSRAADARMVVAQAGPFRHGSTPAERTQAYEDYLATSGHDAARDRGWFEREAEASTIVLPTFRIDLHPVTQSAFAEFVVSTGSPLPHISASDWQRQGFIQHYEREVARFNWTSTSPPEDWCGTPVNCTEGAKHPRSAKQGALKTDASSFGTSFPKGREQHPVVLVPWAAANAYCQWRGRLVGKTRRLPSSLEFEKAARGPKQSIYPWGNAFDATRLNSAVQGPRDTTAVESFPDGNSALGVSDVAGNVFQWTSTPWPHSKGRMTVKGSAWDDQGGLGRAAAAHGRRATISHAIVGFRCAGPA